MPRNFKVLDAPTLLSEFCQLCYKTASIRIRNRYRLDSLDGHHAGSYSLRLPKQSGQVFGTRPGSVNSWILTSECADMLGFNQPHCHLDMFCVSKGKGKMSVSSPLSAHTVVKTIFAIIGLASSCGLSGFSKSVLSVAVALLNLFHQYNVFRYWCQQLFLTFSTFFS